jgi:hypothetical protein
MEKAVSRSILLDFRTLEGEVRRVADYVAFTWR